MEAAGVEFINRRGVKLLGWQEDQQSLRPRLIAGGAGKTGRGLAQPSDNPTLRLPGATLTFNERDIEGNEHSTCVKPSAATPQ